MLRPERIAPFFLVASLGLSGCGASSAQHSDAPTAKDSKVPVAGDLLNTSPRALQVYLRAWEASWRRRLHDLSGGDESGSDFSSAPDASWDRARRYYSEAATAYRQDARRLVALEPTRAMRKAHDAYLVAVQRQETRFQALADAFAGTDYRVMEHALEALEASQLEFDLDGARWEQAVIAACKASGVDVPEIVRQQLISNGHRTKA